MTTRKWIAPSIVVLALAAAKCGGDDANSVSPNGPSSGGSAGSNVPSCL